jgi:predicted GNAT family N-acyltransferase
VIEVTCCNWQQQQQHLKAIRSAVFISEQQVPPAEEWDGLDEQAWHFLALDAHQPVGCARLLADGTIGRMAVIKDYRGQGIGLQLLQQALKQAKQQGFQQATLAAQCHAIAFYQKLGFAVTSEIFLDAGIAHQMMTKKL